jgi:hypothetical protein
MIRRVGRRFGYAVSASAADIAATTHEAVKVFVEKGPQSMLEAGVQALMG